GGLHGRKNSRRSLPKPVLRTDRRGRKNGDWPPLLKKAGPDWSGAAAGSGRGWGGSRDALLLGQLLFRAIRRNNASGGASNDPLQTPSLDRGTRFRQWTLWRRLWRNLQGGSRATGNLRCRGYGPRECWSCSLLQERLHHQFG